MSKADMEKRFDLEINEIMDSCLNKDKNKITSIEYALIKERLIFKIRALLNTLESQRYKNEEKQKIIELMAKDIAENKFDEDICRQIKIDGIICPDENKKCENCVIVYYENKVRGLNTNVFQNY